MKGDAAEVVASFHDLYYNGLPGDGPIYQRTSWLGVPCLKCPLDLWVYQEILWELRPDLVIETGTHLGGSALFLAGVMDAIGHGQVVSIDTVDAERPRHPRVQYLHGSSTDERTIAQLRARGAPATCMVVLDSDHAAPHVARELELYGPLVTIGSYLIVEDTNVNGHPTFPTFGPGPWEAVAEFLRTSDIFEIDRSREKFLMTFNPGGYLKRVR